ncbi:hypothetical protein CJ030_MR8G003333 [Morella rubra]|uniref:BEACH domain-containing protein lvsC n=1 Tax=Morella rubra TaxID=262757 RepID=A0A6A1UU66_9ROSI|nr:hypothetical protein CJ030_MR8G003333 [Morella rubra]
MNIVKGVADLIRRSSGSQTGEPASGSQPQRFSPTGPKICFSEVGNEAVLNTLWERYEKAIDKVERRRLFHVFLRQFLVVYKNWEPVSQGQFSEAASTPIQPQEFISCSDNVVVGCSAGHPAEVISTLTQEIATLTSLITELNSSMMRSTTGLSGASTGLNITSEGLPVLDALAIVTRSQHNCRVFGYCGGIQKLTALMKGAVVQLKTITSAVSADESLSTFAVDKTRLLQQILVYVVSIMCCFIDLDSSVYEKVQLCSNSICFLSSDGASSIDCSGNSKVPSDETRLQWHQKAVVSVMEAGGLNWLVELLRVIRRLSMKEQWTDISLHYLTLRVLCSALSENPRGQNHFKSIGGLEVLLDGLGVPLSTALTSKSSFCADEKRDENPMLEIFQLHILSLEVLREAVFGNLNNLQFLCENGRVQKFANSFCSPAFMLQEYKQRMKDSFGCHSIQFAVGGFKNEANMETCTAEHFPLPSSASNSQLWNDYVAKLVRVLCSFLLAPEDTRSSNVQVSAGRVTMPVSVAYGELSIKWFVRVLFTLFPCIKACSNQNELPSHLRVFVNTLQRYVLDTFRKVLVSSPVLLEVFREERIWDLVFSENFFYFRPASEELSGDHCTYNEGSPRKPEIYAASSSSDSQVRSSGVETLQMEVISFLEFAASSNGSAHNLVGAPILNLCTRYFSSSSLYVLP